MILSSSSKEIKYVFRGARDIVALGDDFVEVRAWAQSVYQLQ